MEKRECFPMFLFLPDHPQLLWSIWNIFNNHSEYSVQSVCFGFPLHAKNCMYCKEPMMQHKKQVESNSLPL